MLVAPQAVVVSFRLGGSDGVAVEARKWAWALGELGFEVRRVAGAIEDDGRPDDTVASRARDRARRGIDDADVVAALDGADLVIVDNLCSLPLNVDAAARGRARRRDPPGPGAVPASRPSVATPPSRRSRHGFPAAHRRRAARDDQPAQSPRAGSARLRRRDDHSQLLRSRSGRRAIAPRPAPRSVSPTTRS